MSITFVKVKKKLTPTGLWDNGLYRVTEEKVNFSAGVIQGAVLEDYECPGVRQRCMRITVGDFRWIVLAEKGKIPASLRR